MSARTLSVLLGARLRSRHGLHSGMFPFTSEKLRTLLVEENALFLLDRDLLECAERHSFEPIAGPAIDLVFAVDAPDFPVCAGGDVLELACDRLPSAARSPEDLVGGVDAPDIVAGFHRQLHERARHPPERVAGPAIDLVLAVDAPNGAVPADGDILELTDHWLPIDSSPAKDRIRRVDAPQGGALLDLELLQRAIWNALELSS